MVLSTRRVSRSPLAKLCTRMLTAPSWPARPCSTAFSTSGCRMRLGTQARATSSRCGTLDAQPVGEALLLQLEVQRDELQLVGEARELALAGVQQPAQQVAELHHHRLGGGRIPGDLSADGVQQVEERVRRELHAQRRQVRLGERALERRGAQLRVAQPLVESEAGDEREPEAVGDAGSS